VQCSSSSITLKRLSCITAVMICCATRPAEKLSGRNS
jgi:hypothetical protein